MLYNSLAAAAALLLTVNAVPVAQRINSVAISSSGPDCTPATATAIASTSGAAVAPLKSGNPFSFPLSNGFDGTLSSDALRATETQAHGTEPNGAAPKLSSDDLTSIQLIAFNEIWEVAFFTNLLYNVTNNVSGFEVDDDDVTKDVLVAIQAQEEHHADSANAILKANGKDVIQPCQYQFPTTNLNDALSLAKTFTDVVLGTLQDVQLHLAQNGDAGVIPIIGSVIGQEGEQTGFFRQSTGLIPSSQPFLTRSTREFAFSALNQLFIVPGSCPNADEIDLPVFTALTVSTPNITAADQTLSFSVTLNSTSTLNGASIVYINSQNTPVMQNISNVQNESGAFTFDADFPFTENLLNGLTIAALVQGGSDDGFVSVEDVVKATIAGPGLIEVN